MLSQYRVHPGQEQRTPAMGVECILERLELANAARDAGFLHEPRMQRVALTRIEALATAWSSRVKLDPSQSQQLYRMGATIAGMLGSLPL